MKKVKKQTEGIFKTITEIKAQQAEILDRLDALGFTATKQKPVTSLKVIQGGLQS